MIKVNLLPLQRRKKPKPVPTFLITGVLLLTVSIILSLYVAYFFKTKITDLQARKTENAQKITRLNETVKEVKDFEALNKKFTERKDIIEQLTKNQSVPVRILDELSVRLTEGVWFNTMDISGGKIQISGVGFSNFDIVSFVQALKQSEFFKEVTLKGTTKTSVGGTDAYNFRITLQVQA